MGPLISMPPPQSTHAMYCRPSRRYGTVHACDISLYFSAPPSNARLPVSTSVRVNPAFTHSCE